MRKVLFFIISRKRPVVRIFARILIIGIIFLLTEGNASSATISIDGNNKFQKITGFQITVLGLLESSDSFGISVDELGEKLINDFGFNIIKIREDLDSFEPVNDNSDPLAFNWDSYNKTFGNSKFSDWFRNIKSFYDGGAKIHLSAFHAPRWMKARTKEMNKFILDPAYSRPELYREIAELWAAPIVYLRDNYDVEIESIVVWNEPTDQWSSFRFSKREYIETVKALGNRFRAEELKTRIIIGDNGFIIGSRAIANAVLNDQLATSYAGGIAYHTYDGFEREEPDRFIKQLKGLSGDKRIASTGLELQMTEWAPTGTDPLKDQALVWAKHIYNCHVFGRTSVFDLWAVMPVSKSVYDPPTSVTEKSMFSKFRWRKHIYAVKQYSKYIDPGSDRIYTGLPDASDIYVSAYMNSSTGRFTVVAINRGTGSSEGVFNIKNIPGLSALEIIRTSAKENAAEIGKIEIIDNSFSYELPGQSITTFTGIFKVSAANGFS